MKALKPSMREKKRYLLVKGENIKENAEKAILEFLGIFGFSESAFHVVRAGKNTAIISINREMVDQIRASFALSDKKLLITKISGSIKNVKSLV